MKPLGAGKRVIRPCQRVTVFNVRRPRRAMSNNFRKWRESGDIHARLRDVTRVCAIENITRTLPDRIGRGRARSESFFIRLRLVWIGWIGECLIQRLVQQLQISRIHRIHGLPLKGQRDDDHPRLFFQLQAGEGGLLT